VGVLVLKLRDEMGGGGVLWEWECECAGWSLLRFFPNFFLNGSLAGCSFRELILFISEISWCCYRYRYRYRYRCCISQSGTQACWWVEWSE